MIVPRDGTPIARVLPVLLASSLMGTACDRGAAPPAGPARAGGPAAAARYVGHSECARCHPAEARAWSTSDHARAMQEADGTTVLGDFREVRLARGGVVSSFLRRDGGFFVRTDGPDGRLHDYRIEYTFGVRPLQQYLVELPGGRLQPLDLAWDARPREAGGGRWFPLRPGPRVAHDDPLRWTGRDQNWNSRCAECHSTDLRPNYDLAADRYATTWSEIDVACEACHGPGSAHVDWA